MPTANGTRVLGTPRLRIVAPPKTRVLRRATDPGFLPGLAGGLGHETLPGMGALPPVRAIGKTVTSPAAATLAAAAQKFAPGAIKPGRYFTRPNAGVAAQAGPVKGMSQRFAIGTGTSGLGSMGRVQPVPRPQVIPGAGSHAVRHASPMYRRIAMPMHPYGWLPGMGGLGDLAGRGMLRTGGVMARYSNPRGIFGLGHMREPDATGMFGLGSDTDFALANQRATHLTRSRHYRNRPISPQRLGRDQDIPGAPHGGFLPGLFCDDAEGVPPAAIGYMSQSDLMADAIPTPAGPVMPAADTTGRTLLIAGGVMFVLGYLLRKAA